MMEEEFNKWFEENEKRFAHGQFEDKQIAYSGWMAGRMEALDLLNELTDLQNGPPLVKYEKEWNECMDKVYTFLDKHNI